MYKQTQFKKGDTDMYPINNEKRYKVQIAQVGKYLNITAELKNVKLLAVEPGFVALEDEEGKEHIYTGGAIGIYISES